MFRLFSCTLETNEEAVFLDYFCEFKCWTSAHVTSLIIASFILIFFSYFVLISIPEFEEMRTNSKKFHFSQDLLFKKTFILMKIMIAGISVLFAFQQILMIYFILFLEISIFIVALFIKPFNEVTRLNIMVRGEFFILIITAVSSITGLMNADVDLNYVIFPIWSLGTIVILVMLLSSPDMMKSYNPIKNSQISKKSERKIIQGFITKGKKK